MNQLLSDVAVFTHHQLFARVGRWIWLMDCFPTCCNLKGCNCLLQACYRLSVTSCTNLRVQGSHVEQDAGLLQRQVLLTHWHTGEGVIPEGKRWNLGGIMDISRFREQAFKGRELLKREPQEQKSLPPCVVNTNYMSWNYTLSLSLNHL